MSALETVASNVARANMVPWDDIDGKTVVVTGATGLIGKTLVASLIQRNIHLIELNKTPITVIALVRNPETANSVFEITEWLSFVEWEAAQEDIPALQGVDYVVHCAAPTSSRFFVECPVETIDSIVNGTRSMLRLAAQHNARFLLLSSMEVYGENQSKAINENMGGELDPMRVRNCYPEAKRVCEAMCAAYSSEYGVTTSVCRLVQCFGPGVDFNDGRVFAEFARCCIQGDDIVLLTDGTKRNMYISTQDAVTAILFLLARGQSGEAYNVANGDTFISVREMAEMVVREFGQGLSCVQTEIDSEAASRFRNGSSLALSLDKITSLGWKATVSLRDMYKQMIEEWQSANVL